MSKVWLATGRASGLSATSLELCSHRAIAFSWRPRCLRRKA